MGDLKKNFIVSKNKDDLIIETEEYKEEETINRLKKIMTEFYEIQKKKKTDKDGDD